MVLSRTPVRTAMKARLVAAMERPKSGYIKGSASVRR